MYKRKDVEIEQLYKKFLPMIKNRAIKWSRESIVGLEAEDLESIGNEIFLTCYEKFNPDKGQFSTFLYRALNNKFYCEVIKWAKCNKRKGECHCIDEIIIPKKEHTEEMIMLRETMQCLSTGARYVIGSALNTPIQMIEQMKQETKLCAVNKKRIQRHLMANEGWGIGKCRRMFEEIKQALSI